MPLTGVHNEREKIMRHLTDALRASFSTRATEPQLVANAVYYLPETINTYIQPLFRQHGMRVEAGGAFIHTRPQGRLVLSAFPNPTPGSVELGDLLVLVRHGSAGYDARAALLLQAKIAGGSFDIPDNPNQHYLYAHWPKFAYTNSGRGLNGQERHIRGPSLYLYSGARYLLITRGACAASCCHCVNGIGPYNCSSFTGQPTYPRISGCRCFATELYDLLFHNADRRFMYRPVQPGIGWNRVVTDLIDASASAVSKYMGRAASSGGRRGQGVLLTGNRRALPQAFSGITGWQDAAFSEGPPDVCPEWGEPNDEFGSGVSIISVTVADLERET